MRKVAEGIAAIPDVPWAVDTDSHANVLAWKLKFVLSEAAPKLKSAPKNDCISSKTWKLLETSSSTKKRLVATRRCEKNIVFHTFFDIWRIIFERPKGDQIVQQFEVGSTAYVEVRTAEVLAHYDDHDAYVHHCCLLNQNLHDLRLQATRKDIIVSIGGDKKAKIEEIATLIPDPMNYKKSGVLWKLIKQVAPGLNKKCSVKPLPILQLEDGTNATTYEEVRKRWQRHFAEIELGQIATCDSITTDIRKYHWQSLTWKMFLPGWSPSNFATMSKSLRPRAPMEYRQFCSPPCHRPCRNCWGRLISRLLPQPPRQ